MWARFRNRLTHLRRRDQIARELDEELAFHKDMLARDAQAEGLGRSAADRAARQRLGNLAAARENTRDAWAFRTLEAIRGDLRLAFRALKRDAVFSIVAVLTLALGMGANFAIFQFVDATLLESLPVSHASELALVSRSALSYPLLSDISAGTKDVFAAVAGRTAIYLNVTVDGSSDYLPAEVVSGGYFSTLGVRPAAGRLIDETDDGAPGAHSVCVISDAFWQRQFGRSPAAIGRYIELNTHPFQIIGVTDPTFEGGAVQSRFDIQVPMSMSQMMFGVVRDSPKWRWLRIIARLNPDVSATAAETAVRARFNMETHPKEIREPLTLFSGRRGFARAADDSRSGAVLLAQLLGLCVLLVGCASLAALLLSRQSARRADMTVRQALGASRGRLIGHMMTEALVLTVAGAICGVGLAAVLDHVLSNLLFGPGTNMHIHRWPSLRATTVAAGLVVVSVAAFALGPALALSRHAFGLDFRDAVRVTRRISRFGRGLVIGQVAICLVLVFGACLFARSLENLQAINTGIVSDHVAVATASPGRAGYTRAAERTFYSEWLRRVQSIPGVQAASLASITAMSGDMDAADVTVPGGRPLAEPRPNNNFNLVTPDYFETVGLGLVAGRAFTDADIEGGPQVAIVNQQFVDLYWPGQSVVGRRMVAAGNDVQIVGVVQTAKYQDVREAPQVVIYRPYAQDYWNQLKLHARVHGDVQSALTAIVRMARDIDPKVPVYDATSMGDYVNAGFANERVLNLLGTLFAGLAVLVAAVGLYGLVAYNAARRTREVGVRIALGARRHQIVELFISRTLVLVLTGIAIGVPMALLAGRGIAGVLYHVEPLNLGATVMAAALLLLVSVAAAGIPALRAARINPTVAIRTE